MGGIASVQIAEASSLTTVRFEASSGYTLLGFSSRPAVFEFAEDKA